MKRLLILFIVIISLILGRILIKESRESIDISKGNIKLEITNDLENIYKDKVSILSIDGNVEDKSRIIYFRLSKSEEEKIAVYKPSFLYKKIKFIGETKNMDEYKEMLDRY